MGPPETYSWEYPMKDNSWEVELMEFFNDIRMNKTPNVSLTDAFKTLEIIEKIYSISNYDYS